MDDFFNPFLLQLRKLNGDDSMNKIIEIRNLTFSYPNTSNPILNNLSFSVKENSWTTLIGHNGSGKSTIARLLIGLLVAEKDKKDPYAIKIDGMELNDENIWKIRDKVGIVFQNPDNQFVGSTVEDDVAFGLENKGISREKMLPLVDEALSQVGMEEFKNSEPAQLSGGQKQRVAIAGILAVKPKIIILDEATSMLDPEGKKCILNLIKKIKQQYNLTVISITHDLEEVEKADEVLVLDNGKIILQDKPEVIFDNANLLNEIGLGLPFIYQLAEKLRQKGFLISKQANTQEKLVKEICQLSLKK